MRIDETDREIIRALQKDGRASLREIARGLGVVEGTIRARLKRLQDERILSVVAFADPFKLGASTMCLAFLKVDPARHEAVLDELEAWIEVSYMSVTLAETDICVQIVCPDQDALWDIRQRIAALPGVRQVAVVASPDPLREEEVLAIIEATAGHDHAALADSIFDACARHLAYYKVPGFLVFTDSMPTTTTQKIRKAALRDIAQAPLDQPGALDWRSRKAALRGGRS